MASKAPVAHIYPVVREDWWKRHSWYRGNQIDPTRSICYKPKRYQAPVGEDSVLCHECKDYAGTALRKWSTRVPR